MASKYYAVKQGRKVGIFRTWEECKAQVNGFQGATYKSFKTMEEANEFMANSNSSFKINKENSDILTNVLTDISTEHNLEKDIATAYIDGSYCDKQKSFSSGIILFYNGNEERISFKMDDADLVSMRNVAGEIKASEMTMQYCIDNNIKAVDIYYDYEGISKWCLGEWKANKLGTIAYKEFYENIKSKLKVNFIKVKAHSGNEYNDIADELAKKALGLL